MRSTLLITALMLAAASSAMAQAQESYNGDVAATYHWVRANAGPGQCGCFGLNGGGISGSWNFRGPWSLVTEFSSEYTGSAPTAGSSLTLTSILAGGRYYLPQPWLRGNHKPLPFAQVLVGAAHAGGGVSGIGDASYGFATRIGGGIDVRLNSRFAVRVIQIDYDLTRIANATNDHQNNLLVGAGIVFHWSHQK
jgi:outer membrane immunogenic protein